MKLSDLKQLIKEELLAEAKKDKSGLPFALAANIEKYGKPQTPKGAKPTHFTKGEEKRVKKTAEKLKKVVKETESTTTGDDNLYDDLPAVDMHIDDNGHMSISIQAMFHSPDNGKVDVLLNDPNLREKVVKAIQQQVQNMFRSTIHRLAGEPYGLKENKDNYMFFQNLKTIKQMVDELLKLDEKMVDGILASGHDWAEDHIATSKDDVEEVYNFLMTKEVVGPVGMDEKKFPDLTGDGKVTYADILKGRGVKLKKKK
jgi:3-polyprenyl-4-hydroxybenzoate decarboxylase